MKLIPTLNGALGRTQLQLQKHGPAIGFYGGLAGISVATVLACRATVRIQPALQTLHTDLTAVSELLEVSQPSRRESARELSYVYGKFAREAVAKYAPSILIASVSVAAMTGSHTTLVRRNVALTGAYRAMKEAYDAYRKKISEELGEDAEERLHYGGPVKTTKGDTTEPHAGYSTYARFFDEYSRNWQKEPGYNKIFLASNQQYVNDLLHSRGHVFLNEVYDALGIPRSSEGALVGWVKDHGDNFVDFGLTRETSIRFMQGWENSVLLDFNVDGVIYDLI